MNPAEMQKDTARLTQRFGESDRPCCAGREAQAPGRPRKMPRNEVVPEGSVSLVLTRRTRSLDHFMIAGWPGTRP